MTGGDSPTVAIDAGDDPATTGTFTREELDAAEPERRRSPGFQWLIGLGLGAFGALYAGFPLGVVALPFALTGAGAGTLLGTGIVFGLSFAFDAVVWLNGELVPGDATTFVAWSLAGFVALIAGAVGSIIVARRARRHAAA